MSHPIHFVIPESGFSDEHRESIEKPRYPESRFVCAGFQTPQLIYCGKAADSLGSGMTAIKASGAIYLNHFLSIWRV
jgi:hypothetical protein